MKVMLVFGTRPEAIKMAPLVKTLKEDSFFKTTVTVTAQHREMLDQVLSLFNIMPDYDLDIMKPGQDLYDITAKSLGGLRDVFKKVNPDIVLVHGDTTTSFVAALAAFYQKIPIGHVEAGLRTYNLLSPWPEEANRQLTSRLATWHFAPTKENTKSLLKENISESAIFETGNTVIDALYMTVDKIEKNLELKKNILSQLSKAGLSQEKLNKKFVLITGHRRENFGEGFDQICKSLKHLAVHNENIQFIYPVHLNPNVQGPVANVLSNLENVHLISPVGYESFIYLMKKCYLVLTDSGGVQEEAPSLGKPVLVMRNNTERPEALESGTVKLVGAEFKSITESVQNLLTDKELYSKMSKAHNPYGDGKASQRIAGFLKSL